MSFNSVRKVTVISTMALTSLLIFSTLHFYWFIGLYKHVRLNSLNQQILQLRIIIERIYELKYAV